jgi:outer membrane protein assembly factor BamB
VGIEVNRWLPRSKEVGQIIKLDPRKNKPGEDPLVWSVPVTKKMQDGFSGIWATMALFKDMAYVPTHTGSVLGIERATGKIVWQKTLTPHLWGSPIVVDDTLIVGDTYGTLHAYDVKNTAVDPAQLWTVKLGTGGAIESTPALWKGRIYVGSRDGYFYCFGDK